MIDGLHEALTKVEKDPAIKCAVLTGNGKAFCAGGDLPFLETLADTAVKKAFITKVGQVAKRITTIEKPIIAMVNGVTAGAGVNLMLACDLIYAVDTAKFAQSFAKVGLIPDCGGLYFLPKAVGVHKAKELMFTADLIDAATAEKMALVNHIFPAPELEDAVMQMAERLAASALHVTPMYHSNYYDNNALHSCNYNPLWRHNLGSYTSKLNSRPFSLLKKNVLLNLQVNKNSQKRRNRCQRFRFLFT